MQSDKSQCLCAQYIYHLAFQHKGNLGHPSWAEIQPSELTFALGLKIKSTNIYLVLTAHPVLVGSAGKYGPIPALSWLNHGGVVTGKIQRTNSFHKSSRGWKSFERFVTNHPRNGISGVLFLKRLRAVYHFRLMRPGKVWWRGRGTGKCGDNQTDHSHSAFLWPF